MVVEWERTEGAPSPLGATWIDEEQAYNFAIYSKHAEQVTLLLYDDHDFATPRYSIPFEFPRNKTNRIWHVRIPAAMTEGTRYYGYRIRRMASLLVGIHHSIGCNRAADAGSMPTCETTPPAGRPIHAGGRLRQNGGRHQIGMLGRIRSERWTPSAQNTWTASVKICTEPRVASRRPEDSA